MPSAATHIWLRNVWTKGDRVDARRVGTQIAVYDSVAGHYTTCHHLRPAQVRFALSRLA